MSISLRKSQKKITKNQNYSQNPVGFGKVSPLKTSFVLRGFKKMVLPDRRGLRVPPQPIHPFISIGMTK
jgi:hypothetical protein